jgi:hypothetical protein
MKTMFQTWLISSVALLVMAAALAHGSVTHKREGNAFGAVIYQDNPNEYLMGQIIRGKLAISGKTIITVLNVAPTNTYGLFFQTVQFCGDVTDELEEGVVVFTYSRVRHTMDCNELFRIDSVGKAK